MYSDQSQLRRHRVLLLVGGAGYLAWWFFVRAALPNAYNPFLGRALVVAGFGAVFAASHASKRIARNLDAWLAACCIVGTAHYFYLFDRNHGDLNWVVGSYVTVAAVCAILQSARSLLVYSLFVGALSAVMIMREQGGSYVVFLPGILTSLFFANVGLRSRLRLLDRLRESNARTESLFEAGFDGIAVHEDGIVRQVNGVLGPLLGLSKEELVGKELPSLFVPEARERAARMIAAGSAARFEADVIRTDGARVTVEVISRHTQGRRKMQQVAFRDLTERKRAEAALVRANRDLEAFSYSVAHDLRGPLRGISGFSSMLRDDYGDRLDDDGRTYLARIEAGAATMGRLIDALLGLARLTRAERQHERVDLSADVEAIVAELRAAQPKRVVDCTIEAGIVAEGDPQLLRVLLDNLVRNAWKFTERKSPARIAFGCEVRADGRTYFVKDDGAGFDMAHAKKLFVPFQRLHVPEDYPGTGIGLATVQRIVERHGGRVWAEGVPNEGATFYFTIEATPPSRAMPPPDG